MQNFKYALFWVFFLLLFVLFFQFVPVGNFLKSLLFIFPVGFIAWLFFNMKVKPSKPERSLISHTNFDKSKLFAHRDLFAFSELVSMCFGDTGQVEQLISFEISKCPGISRAQATRAARDRLLYDRKR
ncbi:MAG: hypothetical protein P4L87_16965 [Formivibrio sp.]|nr:hypothetical protein [Formivibrio sp.]MDR3539820.1 hypothetical protein [Desulfosporosinus sp.]